MFGKMVVFEKNKLTPDKISTQYTDVPPKLAIGIDVKADLSDPKTHNYVQRKTQKVLEFGTEKLIWIFSEYSEYSTKMDLSDICDVFTNRADKLS